MVRLASSERGGAQHVSGTAESQAKSAGHAALGKTTYRVINLAAGDAISAQINAHGQVAYSVTPDVMSAPINAFFYDGSSSRNIGSLDNPGDFARTTGITHNGRVVGVSRNALDELRAFIWNRWSGIADIGTLPGTNEALEPVVNNLGVVTAIAHSDAGVNRGFRWSAGLGITDLWVLAPGPGESSHPRAINDKGTIVGDSWAFGSDYHSFTWTFGDPFVALHAMTWTQGGGLVDLGTLGGFYSSAAGANNSERQAGACRCGQHGRRGRLGRLRPRRRQHCPGLKTRAHKGRSWRAL